MSVLKRAFFLTKTRLYWRILIVFLNVRICTFFGKKLSHVFIKKSANADIQLFKFKSLSTLCFRSKKRSFQMWQNRCQHRDTMKKRYFQMWHFRVPFWDSRLKNGSVVDWSPIITVPIKDPQFLAYDLKIQFWGFWTL